MLMPEPSPMSTHAQSRVSQLQVPTESTRAGRRHCLKLTSMLWQTWPEKQHAQHINSENRKSHQHGLAGCGTIGGLAVGMFAGAIGEGLSRAVGGGGQGSMMLSAANMERLVAKLSRMQGPP